MRSIREKSELNFIKYAFVIVIPRILRMYAESFKEAKPFFANTFMVIPVIILSPFIAIIERSNHRRFIYNQDKRNEIKKAKEAQEKKS